MSERNELSSLVELALRGERELEPIEVAVIDSGVDGSHLDLADRIEAAFSVDMVEGEARVSELPIGANNDRFGHGTGVASIISKLAPNARLVDIRVLGTSNVGTGEALLRGAQLAITRGSRIINMSLAAKRKLRAPLMELCELAYRQNQLVVAAKRNVPLFDLGFPAELSAAISVDREALGSPYSVGFRPDSIVEFTADGDDVRVAAAGGGYTSVTGTSFATPAVSAICAVLLGNDPSLRPFDVKSMLRAASLTA